jgi:hypothetical protein
MPIYLVLALRLNTLGASRAAQVVKASQILAQVLLADLCQAKSVVKIKQIGT